MPKDIEGNSPITNTKKVKCNGVKSYIFQKLSRGPDAETDLINRFWQVQDQSIIYLKKGKKIFSPAFCMRRILIFVILPTKGIQNFSRENFFF